MSVNAITIEFDFEVMTVHEGEVLDGSRKEWACSDLDVYIIGEMTGERWEQAWGAVRNIAYERHIPAHSFRRVNYRNPAKRGIKTDTRSMWEKK